MEVGSLRADLHPVPVSGPQSRAQDVPGQRTKYGRDTTVMPLNAPQGTPNWGLRDDCIGLRHL